ncbi:nuclear transport factor 2 family protein [Haloterrigena alkaliphila]|uniref:Nuclear transport factor 2 family protein n=1 Tax=Haloterrigena alkaliphila TaxID=2816475 RepID=A0A8A2VH97_9EURY|nr:nuclear transport factor 2 family protein [Haloterrigena alkaliphila]QSX00071.1 nuclear transport factor 2 family protein [Haloterrigena alkaliphila]
MDSAALVRQYYDALDSHAYETLEEDVLVPDFVQRRPDRTFEGREAFVRFMREDRPNTDTSHDLASVVVDSEGDRVAVRGRVLDDDGPLFEFADFFELANGRIVGLETYSR